MIDKDNNLKSQVIKNLLAGTLSARLTRTDGWSHIKFLETEAVINDGELIRNKVTNIFHEYQRNITMTGASSESFDLANDFPFELQRINLRFSDSTSKSFTVDVYESINSNARIMSYSNHTQQYYEDVVVRKFILPYKISIGFTSSTNLKTCDITILLRELLPLTLDMDFLKQGSK